MPKITRKHEWKDQYTLLCESCGYIIEDLDHSLPCPECGKPITESLPERRIGTPWQQKPGFKSLLQTWWMTIRHPKQLLDIQATAHPHLLTLITITIASFITSVGWWLPSYLPDLSRRGVDLPSLKMTVILILLFASIPFILFTILTFIETQGLRVIGKGKEFRATQISGAITAHGSVGWLLCSIGLALTQLLGYATDYIMVETSSSRFGIGSLSGDPISFTPPLFFTNYWLLVSLVLPGFFFFEYFAYLGLRRCKYANTLPPQSPPQKP